MFPTFIRSFPSGKGLQRVLTGQPSFPEGTTQLSCSLAGIYPGVDRLRLPCADACEPALPANPGTTQTCSHACAHATEPAPSQRPGLQAEIPFPSCWEVCVSGCGRDGASGCQAIGTYVTVPHLHVTKNSMEEFRRRCKWG